MSITVKLRFYPSLIKGRKGTLHYQLTYHRQSTQRASVHKIFPDEWDKTKATIKLPEKSDARHDSLMTLKHRLRWEVCTLCKIADEKLQENENTPPEVIFEAFESLNRQQPFLDFMYRQIDRLKEAGQLRTGETYLTTLHSFMRFRAGQDIMLYEITPEEIENYGLYLKRNKLSPNTSSFYMRILRATWNRAVRQHLVRQIHPFRNVYTGIGSTAKRAIGIEEIRRIKALDLSANIHLDYARDIFLLSLYLRGMSFIDMAYLTTDNLQNGFLEYKRKKTGQRLTIRWEEKMQTVLDKYIQDEKYLLPILKSNGEDERAQYKRVGKQVNRWLKRIGMMAHLPIGLTLYVARHSWASIAKQKNIPIGIISDGLGHDSEKTTQIYLAELDTSAVDRANNIILKDL